MKKFPILKIYLLLTLLAQLGWMGFIGYKLGITKLFFYMGHSFYIYLPIAFSLSALLLLVGAGSILIMMPGGLFLVHYFQINDKQELKSKKEVDQLRRNSDHTL